MALSSTREAPAHGVFPPLLLCCAPQRILGVEGGGEERRLEMQGIGWRDGVRSTDLDLNAPPPPGLRNFPPRGLCLPVCQACVLGCRPRNGSLKDS